MKKAICILLVCLAALWITAGAGAEDHPMLGKTLEDFSVETIDGETFSLSGALREKKMVLLNLWAIYCGPCEMEFPYMEEAYQQFSDRAAVIALSIDPADTKERLQDYAASHGMTFAVGSDSATNLASRFVSTGIPTTVVIDRFGKVALVHAGAEPSAEKFAALFDYFTDDSYTQTQTLTAFPPPRASEGVSPEELSAAANAEGSALLFRNGEGRNAWPMVPAGNGEQGLISSNTGVDLTTAAVYTTVTAQEGDALAFRFLTSTEFAMDVLFVSVDGKEVKCFTGEHPWTDWAIALPAGEHEIAFGYRKDEYVAEGEDLVRVADVRQVSGAEAAELLAAVPARPVSPETKMRLIMDDMRQVIFDDPAGVVPQALPVNEVWVAYGDSIRLEMELGEDADPETAFVLADSTVLPGKQKADGSGYEWIIPVNRQATQVISLIAAPGTRPEQLGEQFTVAVFYSEDAVDGLVDYVAQYGYTVAWRFADGGGPREETGETASSAYTVKVVDQNGDPVPEVVVNFCTDTACTPKESDGDGIIVFSGEPYRYHLEIVDAPEGYTWDETFEAYTEEEYGTLTITVTKE